MKIREISPGTDGQDDSYVEVQMYAPFQNFLSGGAALLVCNPGCTPTPTTLSPFTDVAHGDSQDTVVFGDTRGPERQQGLQRGISTSIRSRRAEPSAT